MYAEPLLQKPMNRTLGEIELEDIKNKSLCNITYDELKQMDSLSDTHLDELAKICSNKNQKIIDHIKWLQPS